MARMVMVRIRRMGKQWATCGIGIRPPEEFVRDPRMKKLCPKLVPGQVVRLPSNHPILRPENSELVERVTRLQSDEFERPWVFKSAEDAVLANPSLSQLSADRIAEGLALTEGAQFNQRKRLAEREAKIEEEYGTRSGGPRHDDEPETDEEEFEDPEDDELGDDENAKRSRNRVLRDVKDEAKPVEDDEEEEAKPVARARGRRGRSGS